MIARFRTGGELNLVIDFRHAFHVPGSKHGLFRRLLRRRRAGECDAPVGKDHAQIAQAEILLRNVLRNRLRRLRTRILRRLRRRSRLDAKQFLARVLDEAEQSHNAISVMK